MANEFKVKKGLVVDGSGTVLDVQGTQGQLFSVTDSLTGDLFSVSDISGIPILNVNSSGVVDIDGTLDVGGVITATSGSSTNWNTAYTHSQATHAPVNAEANVYSTAAELLTAIKTVDGASSGLDADQLDGYNAEEGAVSNSIVKRDGTASIKAYGLSLMRSSTPRTGITWYNEAYYNWQDYMASAGTTGCGPNGNLTAPAGLAGVSSWALRSRMEGNATYGWNWETGTGGGGGGATATSKMSLNATTGNLQIAGTFTATGGTSTEWNTAYDKTLQWDGSSTALVAATGRTSLGLGTAATTASGAYATAAQGTLATNALPKAGGTLTGDLTVSGNQVITANAIADVKFSVWSGTTYGIGMTSGVTYGNLNGYAMTFCMNNDADRGWWWGYSGQSKSSGAMSLTMAGHLTLAGNATISGTVSASNLSNTNTGDQTTVSGNAGTVTNGAYVNVANNFTTTQKVTAGDPKLNLVSSTSPSLTAGIGTQVGGRLLSFGTNYTQTGTSTTSYAGGFFRIDTRVGYEAEFFTVQKAAVTTGTQSVIFRVKEDGDVGITGDLGIGTTSPLAKLDVRGTLRSDQGQDTGPGGTTGVGEIGTLIGDAGPDDTALGTPNKWLKINLDGNDYLIPAYSE